eukprot:5593-Heterococcus_DN1.PRE.5
MVLASFWFMQVQGSYTCKVPQARGGFPQPIVAERLHKQLPLTALQLLNSVQDYTAFYQHHAELHLVYARATVELRLPGLLPYYQRDHADGSSGSCSEPGCSCWRFWRTAPNTMGSTNGACVLSELV